jgi:hypothetical protein
MSNLELQIVTCAVVAAQLAVVLWILVRRRGMWPALAVNFVFAAGVLWSVAPYVVSEVTFALSDPDSDLLDYKNTILTVFESVTALGSLLAFRNLMAARIVAWLGFAGNFGLSLAAALFALTFEFKCCGYL